MPVCGGSHKRGEPGCVAEGAGGSEKSGGVGYSKMETEAAARVYGGTDGTEWDHLLPEIDGGG
jgi:hypothetical protein